jgi:hypothetical protein
MFTITKTNQEMRTFTGFIALLLIFAACNPKKNATETNTPVVRINDSTEKKEPEMKPDSDSVLIAESALVLGALCSKDTAAISKAVAPGGKLLFSPYGHIDTSSALKFTGASLSKAFMEKKKINWGKYDGSGKPILLTPDEYFGKFVCNIDFSKYDSIRVNSPIAKGNSLNNLSAVFPGCSFVEYYHKGTEKMSGLDWYTLRLVYNMVDGRRYLVAVVHDQWTS